MPSAIVVDHRRAQDRTSPHSPGSVGLKAPMPAVAGSGVPKSKQPEPRTSSIRERGAEKYWFCDYVGFEEKKSRANRLIVDLRHWSPERGSTVTATVYLNEPATISSEFIFGLDSLEKMINEFKGDPKLADCPMKVYLSAQLKAQLEPLKRKYSEVVFENRKDRYSVINVDVPYDTQLLENLSRKWQTGNFNRQIRGKLGCLYRKVRIDDRLAEALVMTDQIRTAQDEMRRTVKGAVEEGAGIGFDPRDRVILSARTRLENEIDSFFGSYDGEMRADAVLSALDRTASDKHCSLRRFAAWGDNRRYIEEIMCIKRRIKRMLSGANDLLGRLNRVEGEGRSGDGRIAFNPESGEYELSLSSMRFFSFNERLTMGEIRDQVSCYIDIEKPMWKNSREKTAIKRRKELLRYIGAVEKALNTGKRSKRNSFLIRLNSSHNGSRPKAKELSELSDDELNAHRHLLLEKVLKARRLIARLEGRLTITVEGIGEVNLWEDRYDAKVSQVVDTFKLEDSSLVRQYYKIKYNPEYSPAVMNGFPVFEHKDEHALLTSIVLSAMRHRPFSNVAHVITYDLPQLREATRTNRTDLLDIVVPDKEPSLAYARDFYRKMAQTGQEMLDTCMLGRTLFPYLRINAMHSSHKLVDLINYVRSLKHGDDFERFEKIATHKELRFLELRRQHGFREDDEKMDEYTTGDSAPMEELIDFFLDFIEPIYRLMPPDMTLTDIAFSPGCMDSILRWRHWKENHNQHLFGYKQKERQDIQKIFNNRDPSYHKRKLQSVGINTSPAPGQHRNVYLVHVPRAEWLKRVALVRYPELGPLYEKLDSLGGNPVMKVGLLQYLNRFFRSSYLPDYYRYRREQDIELQYRERLGAEVEGDDADRAINLMFIKYKIMADNISPGLMDKYYTAYEQVKNLYRSFYTSLNEIEDKRRREEVRRLIRAPGGKREKREDNHPTFDFYNLFYEENRDLMALHKLHELRRLGKDLEESLPERSVRLLRRYQSVFESLNGAFKSLQTAAAPVVHSNTVCGRTMTAENLVYFHNQHLRAEKKRKEFIAKYRVLPEPASAGPEQSRLSFKDAVDTGYDSLARELVEKRIAVVAQQGDYLFIKAHDESEIDFSAVRTVLPIKRFEEFSVTSAALEPEDEEIASLFGEDADEASGLGAGEEAPLQGRPREDELTPVA